MWFGWIMLIQSYQNDFSDNFFFVQKLQTTLLQHFENRLMNVQKERFENKLSF